MIIALDTDASYLYEHGFKIRAAKYMFLINKYQPDFHNGARLILSGIIKPVMSSASEAEMGVFTMDTKVPSPSKPLLKNWDAPKRGKHRSPLKTPLPMASL